jgi:hypothetical protein
MIMIEHYSKWVELIVLPDKSSHSTSHDFLQHVLNRFGACAKCFIDQGSKLRGEFQDLFDHDFIDHHWISRDHPQVDGLVERMVQTCKKGFTLEYLPHWEQKGLGLGLTLHHHRLHDVQTHFFVSFVLYFFIFWETSHSTFFHCCSNGCELGLPKHLARVLQP